MTITAHSTSNPPWSARRRVVSNIQLALFTQDDIILTTPQQSIQQLVLIVIAMYHYAELYADVYCFTRVTSGAILHASRYSVYVERQYA